MLTRAQEQFTFPSAKAERPLNVWGFENIQKRDQVILGLKKLFHKPPNKALKAEQKTIQTISKRWLKEYLPYSESLSLVFVFLFHFTIGRVKKGFNKGKREFSKCSKILIDNC